MKVAEAEEGTERVDSGIKTSHSGGTWVVHLGQRPTPDFGSGHDLRAVGSSPASGSALTARSLLGILSPAPSAPPPLTRSISLSLKIEK